MCGARILNEQMPMYSCVAVIKVLPFREKVPSLRGRRGARNKTLSVTCGDSSPKGRAKGQGNDPESQQPATADFPSRGNH